MARLLTAAEELALMGSWELDLRSGETLWSDGIYRILGLAPAGERQTLAQALGHVHPDDRERIERMLADVAERPETVPEAGIEHVVRLVRDDGSVRELRAHYAVSQALRDWESFELGVVDLLRRIATAFCSFERRAPSAELVRTLTAIGRELGRFLGGRQAELGPAPLSEREIEVLRLAVEGLSGPGIAEQLVLSPATVKTHFEHIYEKLGVGDRAAAVAQALRSGVIH